MLIMVLASFFFFVTGALRFIQLDVDAQSSKFQYKMLVDFDF